MVAPLSPDRLLAVLRAEGVQVAEHAGWRTNERDDETGKTFGPVHGVLIHHTVSTSSLAVVFGGRTGLPGPLAHSHLAKSGLCTMVSAGRANHAGLVAVNAYQAVLAEAVTHPAPSKSSGTVDGNDFLYGIEIENLGDGNDPYPGVQYDAAVRWAAALCRAHSWSAHSVVGHKETSVEGKIDPSFSMTEFRADVATRLAHTADWNPNEEDDMPTADEIAAAVWNYKVDSPTAAPGTDPKRTTGTFLRYTDAKHAAATAQIGALQGAVTALTEAVGAAGGITAEQVQAAATAGAEAALDRLGDALTEGN